MEYVVVFFAGMLAAGAVLGIGFYGFAAKVWKGQEQVKAQSQRIQSDFGRISRQHSELEQAREQLNSDERAFRDRMNRQESEFNSRKVSYDKLVGENNVLKQDLFNLNVQIKKTTLDQLSADKRQDEIEKKSNVLAEQYLDENVAWIGQKLNSNNFVRCKEQLLKAIERCRSIGFEISEEEAQRHVDDLREKFEKAVRLEFQRQEQARIKAQIREEEKLAREIEKHIKDAEREEKALRAALNKALQEAEDEHSAEIENLRAKLKEAEEKAQKAKSQAQLTKSGHVYVLSNIGSFGEGIFKVGMTRRLEPNDRVKELGDASVPFPFDVHMMISCDNAPSLENSLHHALHKHRVNKVNLRKEYFKVNFDEITRVVEVNHGDVDYVAHPDAEQFRQSLEISEEDEEFVESVYDSLMGEDGYSDED